MNRASDLLLRRWTEADAAALREAIDEDVGHLKPWLSWTLEEPVSVEQTRQRLAGYVDQYRVGEAYRYAITSAERPHLILGGANVYPRHGRSAFEIGYWVRKSAARMGVAQAAVAALLVEVFRRPHVERVSIRCDVTNTASAAFAERIGFQFAQRVDGSFADGSPRPLRELAMTAGDYRERESELREQARRVRWAVDALRAT